VIAPRTGGRGLKPRYPPPGLPLWRSPPARGARIETLPRNWRDKVDYIAPRTGGAD